MPRNSGGTYSLPAGNPVTAGTTISSTTHNNTESDIAQALTDSLSRDGEGAMLAPLELVNGSVGTPALSFDSDTDTGLYRAAANTPAMAAGGVQATAWNANGLSLSSATKPTSSAAFTSAVTPNNLVKAWVTYSTNTGAPPTVLDGFNVTSLTTTNTTRTTLTMASAMADTNYAVFISGINTAMAGTVSAGAGKTTTTFEIRLFDLAGAEIDQVTSGTTVSVMVIGRQ